MSGVKNNMTYFEKFEKVRVSKRKEQTKTLSFGFDLYFRLFDHFFRFFLHFSFQYVETLVTTI